jgi:protein TonB
VFQLLLESHPQPRPAFAWGTGAAFMLHAAVAALLLRSPAQARPPARVIVLDSLPVPQTPRPTVAPPSGSLVIDARGTLPPLPQIEVPVTSSLCGLAGLSVAETGGALLSQDTTGSGTPTLLSAIGEERPVLLSAPPPDYPPALRDAGVEGTVVVRLIVDSLGGVEPGTVRVVRSDHPGLAAPAAQSLRLARFRPARVAGRAVRVLVEVPVRFRLRR